MKDYKLLLCIAISFLFVCTSCNKHNTHIQSSKFLGHAQETLDSIYSKFEVNNENLLRENYPFNEHQNVTYLNNTENTSNKFAYLWPYSGTFSAVKAIYIKTNDPKYLTLLQNKVIPGLKEYYDTERHPYGYASYINRAPLSDRYYDDNIWIGIDFIELYIHTKEYSYLQEAQSVWNFVYSGYDNKLGGGIYWVESNKASKNTCSNAPAIVFALKLYEATNNKDYLNKAESLYNWTKNNLQDPTDKLYYDNIKLDGTVDKQKYAYNSGQMLSAASLFYKITGEKSYLDEAKNIAESCYNHFFHDFTEGEYVFKMLNKDNVWFSSIMARGFLDLYTIDKEFKYINAFIQNLSYAWSHMREDDGLFGTDWEGKDKKPEKWLLTQTAMVEMYTNFYNINIQ